MTFNGVDSFTSYVELRSLTCVGFIFTWSYLVKFHNKQSAEKQEILISSLEENAPKAKNTKSIQRLLRLILDDVNEISGLVPKITYSVKCTDKTWGVEISELIRKHLLKSMKANLHPYFKVRQIVTENSFLICFFFPSLILFAYLFYKAISDLESPSINICNDFLSSFELVNIDNLKALLQNLWHG
jgi:hypothetical protein